MKARSEAAALLASILIAGCASTVQAPAPAPATVALQNAAFQDPVRPGENCPVGWGCTMHNDPQSFRFFHDEGAHGYCIESVGREPWAQLTQAIWKDKVVPLRGARVRLSISMKLDSMTAGQAGPSILALGPSGRLLGEAVNLQDRKEGWQRVDTAIEVPSDASVLEVGARFQGKGRVCVDDVRLEITAPPGAPV